VVQHRRLAATDTALQEQKATFWQGWHEPKVGAFSPQGFAGSQDQGVQEKEFGRVREVLPDRLDCGREFVRWHPAFMDGRPTRHTIGSELARVIRIHPAAIP